MMCFYVFAYVFSAVFIHFHVVTLQVVLIAWETLWFAAFQEPLGERNHLCGERSTSNIMSVI